MRADRLLRILNVLQAHGRATAVQLSGICEVSLRTIYRDIEALSAAGIAVYAERGALGGYRLVDGHRTRLNGLSSQEAELLFLSGLPLAATGLGVQDTLRGAQDKLLAALPASLRNSAARLRGRFHHDAPAWFAHAEQPVHLPLVADAVWRQRALRMRYRSWKGEKDRVVEPLGLVLKSGTWYLVAGVEGDTRTYRVARIADPELLEHSFERPVAFDLAEYWQASLRKLEQDLHGLRANARVSPRGAEKLETLLPAWVYAATTLDQRSDAQGWRVATIPIHSIAQGCMELLRFGAELEVLDPPELRQAMAAAVAALSKRYASNEGGWRDGSPTGSGECGQAMLE